MFSDNSKPYSWVPSVLNVIIVIFVVIFLCGLGLALCSWWVKTCAGLYFEALNCPLCKLYFHVDWTLPVPLNLVHLMFVCFFRSLYFFTALCYMGGGVAGVVVAVVWLLGNVPAWLISIH